MCRQRGLVSGFSDETVCWLKSNIEFHQNFEAYLEGNGDRLSVISAATENLKYSTWISKLTGMRQNCKRFFSKESAFATEFWKIFVLRFVCKMKCKFRDNKSLAEVVLKLTFELDRLPGVIEFELQQKYTRLLSLLCIKSVDKKS